MYIIDAKIFPADLSYMVRIVKYVLPNDNYFVKQYIFKEG